MMQSKYHGQNSGCDTPASEENKLRRIALSIATIVLAAVIIVSLYSVRLNDRLSSQARDLGRIFIQSSPVVEADLGTVHKVKETYEQYRSGVARGWYVDFHVSGERASGAVKMRVQNDGGQWDVTSAQLKEGQNGPVNLR